MGRRSGESYMMIGSGSSIALLQERFKQLDRVREKRQGKELLKLFWDADSRIVTPTGIGLFQQYQLGDRLDQPGRPTHVHDPLSLELGCWEKCKHGDEDINVGDMKNMSHTSPNWATGGLKLNNNNGASGSHEGSEIDTSLRL
uniref:Uncharacterized protein n=1 Tax=Kalanchoe fedtschenkoi TaxID=63787 RepID=A0A7N0RIR9_KALFE